jgi:hypothetical protein
MSFFTERELGRAFKLELENEKFLVFDKRREPYSTRFKVYLNKPVQTNKGKFIDFWKTKNLDLKDIPPSQPEIDMILVDELGIWRGIELKAIKKTERKTKKEISSPYYIGLGQTFAYLSYGIDEVALWQCFDGNSMTDKEIFDYNDALGKIRAPIESFVDATYFKILNEEQNPKIQTAVFYRNGEKQWREWQNGIGIHQPETGEYRFTCGSSNPFLKPFQTPTGIFPFNQNIVNRVRAVRAFLELQKTELWDNEP